MVRASVNTNPWRKRSFSKTPFKPEEFENPDFTFFSGRKTIWNFTITAEIHARSLVNFYRQYADRHMNLKFNFKFMNLKFMWRVSARERAIRPFVIVKTNRCQFLMSLFYYWQWISSSHSQSSLRIRSAVASWIHSYFDNVMTKFMINNRTDA